MEVVRNGVQVVVDVLLPIEHLVRRAPYVFTSTLYVSYALQSLVGSTLGAAQVWLHHGVLLIGWVARGG